MKNEDIVKAYEYAKNKFVVLDAEDLEQLKKEQEDKAVEIIDFVKLEEIDPIYFEKSYFLAPDSGGGKAYGLLREGLLKAGKIGVAKIIIRSKEQLAIVRVYQTGLMMETIHFPDEVRKFEDVPNIPEGQEIVKKELDAALMLIDQLTTPFDPDKYQDEYRHALMDLIEKKKSGEEIVTASEKPKEASNVTDIMSALQASIDQTKKKKAPAKKKATTKTKKNA